MENESKIVAKITHTLKDLQAKLGQFKVHNGIAKQVALVAFQKLVEDEIGSIEKEETLIKTFPLLRKDVLRRKYANKKALIDSFEKAIAGQISNIESQCNFVAELLCFSGFHITKSTEMFQNARSDLSNSGWPLRNSRTLLTKERKEISKSLFQCWIAIYTASQSLISNFDRFQDYVASFPSSYYNEIPSFKLPSDLTTNLFSSLIQYHQKLVQSSADNGNSSDDVYKNQATFEEPDCTGDQVRYPKSDVPVTIRFIGKKSLGMLLPCSDGNILDFSLATASSKASADSYCEQVKPNLHLKDRLFVNKRYKSLKNLGGDCGQGQNETESTVQSSTEPGNPTLASQ